MNYISFCDYQFNLFDIYNDEEVEDKLGEYLDKFNSQGHKLLGYPFFVQEDIRCQTADEDPDPYILLFQIDSDRNNNGCNIIWGDSGIANFFIVKSDLKKLDFSRVMYNWDCA